MSVAPREARQDPDSAAPGGRLRHAVELTRQTLPPIHRAGRPFVIGGMATTLLLRSVSRRLGALAGLGTLATAAFFREPARTPPHRTDLVVAAADGTVSVLDEAAPPPELGLGQQPRMRISVFLSLLDVHVQRIPAAGTVRRVAYHRGTFLSADLDKASEDNERNSMLLRTTAGHEVVAVQIAGLLARRIVCDVDEGAEVDTGDTYGLIRFGSRVDVYLPAGSEPLVRTGQRAVGGETALATLPAPHGGS